MIYYSDKVKAEITDIFWERVWLKFTVKVTGDSIADKSFYILNDRDRCVCPLLCEEKFPGYYELSVNITNIGSRRCIPEGRFRVAIGKKKNEFNGSYLVLEKEIVARLKEKAGHFLFGNGTNSYNVDFVAAVADVLEFNVRIVKTDNGVSTPKTELKKVYRKNMRSFLRKLYRTERKKHFAEDKKPVILLFSEQNDGISTNLLSLKLRMLERVIDRDFEITESYRITVTSRHLGFTSWVNVVTKLARADYIFMDDHAPILDWLELDKKVVVTQLWHAGVGFKASGYSRWGHFASPAPFSCHRQYTYGIAGSKKVRPVFSEIWGIDACRVLPTGLPRIDDYLNEDHRKMTIDKLRDRFKIIRDKKVILFAPTYRGKNRFGASYPYEKIDFEGLKEACGDKFVVLFKMHPWVLEPVPIPDSCKDVFLDVSSYSAINDLFYITDLLVTDYSSNIYEYSLMGKPMLFYAFDEQDYENLRGFHVNYEEAAPGKVVRSSKAFIKAIKEEDFEVEKVKEYVDRNFDNIDTHCSDRIIDWVLLDKMPEDIRDEIMECDMASSGYTKRL